MTTTFINGSWDFSASADHVSVAAPTNTQDDDLMLALVYGAAGFSGVSPPSGWEQRAVSGTHALYSRVASSESGTDDFYQNGTDKIRCTSTSWRGGFDISDPIGSISNTTYTVNDAILRAASFSVAKPNSEIIFCGTCWSTSTRTFTPPTNPGTFIERVDDGDTDSDVWQTFAQYNWSSSGSTGNIDATMSATNQIKHAFAVSLNPEPPKLGLVMSIGF